MENKNLNVILNSDINFIGIPKPQKDRAVNLLSGFMEGKNEDLIKWIDSVREIIQTNLGVLDRPALLTGGIDITGEILELIKERH